MAATTAQSSFSKGEMSIRIGAMIVAARRSLGPQREGKRILSDYYCKALTLMSIWRMWKVGRRYGML